MPVCVGGARAGGVTVVIVVGDGDAGSRGVVIAVDSGDRHHCRRLG